MTFNTSSGTWYRVSQQHHKVATQALENAPELVAHIEQYEEPGYRESNDAVYETSHAIAGELDEKTVVELFLKSDWDTIEPGLDTHEARMIFMRNIVGLNIADSMYQKVLNVEQWRTTPPESVQSRALTTVIYPLNYCGRCNDL